MSEDLQVKFLTFFKQYKQCIVDFTKVNGDRRIMTCSLDESLLPKQDVIVESTRKKPQGSIAVFDLTAQAWRSFKVSSVKQFIGIEADGQQNILYTIMV